MYNDEQVQEIRHVVANRLQPLMGVIDLLVDGKHISPEVARMTEKSLDELVAWSRNPNGLVSHDWDYGDESDAHSEQMKVVDYLCENTENTYYRGYEYGKYLRYVRNRLAAAEHTARTLAKLRKEGR